MDELIKKTLVMVLCGGKGERLFPLTRDRSKPSVPFLGSYRIIDFSLSNALNSGLRRIALLTQYKSLSLERHILNGWNIFHAESGDFLISLPAQGRVGDHWYEGTADAVFQNIYTIQQENPDLVLVLSGDHVYSCDYRRMLVFMRQHQADAVILTRHIPCPEASRFGIISVDPGRRILDFIEKPKKPTPTPWNPAQCLISMGVYLFSTPVLIRALLQDARLPRSSHDFGRDVIPRLIKDFKIFAYPFEGYWEDIGTLDAYWAANMSFLTPDRAVQLLDPSWPVRTYKPQFPATFIRDGEVRNSIIGDGVRLVGCRIKTTILSPGVVVHEGAEVTDSILFEGVEIRPGARLKGVIIDKFARIPERLAIGFDEEKDSRAFKVSRGGVRIVPKNWKSE
ncbi:MAG: sugar phosphate nucleotidyltransferase [Candidatus Aminicenantes bacterium]|nr:sugar phosphate nucleotidyltransferase [Candidatus Aminicenantes bacterium]